MRNYAAQIGLVPHAHTLIEWGIQEVTNSPIHHALLGLDETYCISCEPEGAIIRLISDFPEAYWSDFQHDAETRDKIVAWAMAHEGDPYGYFADAAIFVNIVLKQKTPAFIARYLNNGTHFECAQFCDAAFSAAGVQLFDDGRLPGAVWPGAFVPIFIANGFMTAVQGAGDE